MSTPPPKYLSYPKWMYDLALEIIHRELSGVDNMSALADLLPHPLRDIAAGMLEYDRHRAASAPVTPVMPLSESPLAKVVTNFCELCHGPVGGDHPGHPLPDGGVQHDSIGSCNTVGTQNDKSAEATA